MPGRRVERMPVRLVSNLKAHKLTAVMLPDIARDVGVRLHVAIQQPECVDYFHVGCFREGEELIDLRRAGDFVLRPIGGSSSDAQVADSDYSKELNQFFVRRAELIRSIFVRDKVRRFEAQASEVVRND